MTMIERRQALRWLGTGISSGLVLATSFGSEAQEKRPIRIGYQKSATLLNALKSRGSLEKAVTAKGIEVQWNEFVAGPQLLEGINVGSIDFGYTGEAPPVFAQAAGAPLRYVAYDPLGGKAEAILVLKDSPIKSVADLKGKKVVLNKGSNVHYLLVKALESAGLKYSDITPVFLPPADARPAFEGNQVDAWVIWDPFLAATEHSIGARILTNGEGLVANYGYYLASQSFTDQSPDLVKILLEELTKVNQWAAKNSQEVTAFLSPQLGIPSEALLIAEARRRYGVLPISDAVISAQQKVADTFYELKLIPRSISVKSIIWKANA